MRSTTTTPADAIEKEAAAERLEAGSKGTRLCSPHELVEFAEMICTHIAPSRGTKLNMVGDRESIEWLSRRAGVLPGQFGRYTPYGVRPVQALRGIVSTATKGARTRSCGLIVALAASRRSSFLSLRS